MDQQTVNSSPAFADTLELRKELIATRFYLRDRLNYFIGTWGNISVRLKDGLLVTPTRMTCEQLTPEDLVVVDWEGSVIRGHRVPTSETQMHRVLLLQRPDIGALVHSHAPWASVMACAHATLPVISDDMAEVIGGPVCCTPYVQARRHKELAEAVRDAIGTESCAVFIANHGVICGGRSLEEAVYCCQFVEKASMIYVQAQAIGGAKPVPEQSWRQERHRYLHSYGSAQDVSDVVKQKS